MSSVTPSEQGQGAPTGTGTVKALGGILVLVLLLVIAGLVVLQVVDRSDEPAGSSTSTSSARSGTVELARTERRVVIDFEGALTDASQVGASAARRTGTGRSLAARVVGPTEAETQFRVVLDEPAPRGGATVTWNVTGLEVGPDDSSNASAWSTEWVVVLALMGLSLLAALAAYVLAVRRRQAGADGRVDVGPELASFLKVAALLMIAALALIAVMLATDDKSLTGLFALLGTIAGYLAGNRSETTGRPGRGGERTGNARTRGNGGNGGGLQDGDADDQQALPGTVQRTTEARPSFETRSLL